MNWMTSMQNYKGWALKKVLHQFLKERYAPHDEIIERVSTSLVTEKDMQDFMKLLTSVYEAGFEKSVELHKDQLEKLGLSVRMTQGPNDGV